MFHPAIRVRLCWILKCQIFFVFLIIHQVVLEIFFFLEKEVVGVDNKNLPTAHNKFFGCN